MSESGAVSGQGRAGVADTSSMQVDEEPQKPSDAATAPSTSTSTMPGPPPYTGPVPFNFPDPVSGAGMPLDPHPSPHSHSPTPKPPTPIPPPPSNPPTLYEFTKRKNWSSLLLSQLSGTIQLVLSPRGKIAYVSGSVREFLGWDCEEVVDKPLADLVHPDDIHPLVTHIHNAIVTRSSLSAYARLLTKDSCTPLFEIRGHPHFLPSPPSSSSTTTNTSEELGTAGVGRKGRGVEPDKGVGAKEYACFFCMARPYPSRPAALLDSFLDLKIENEHLKQRLAAASSSASSSSSTLSPNTAVPSHAHALGLAPSPTSAPPPQQVYLSAPSSSTGTKRDFQDGAEGGEGAKRRKKSVSVAVGGDVGPGGGGEGKEGGKQYVCVMCGRTDSPEWRKGPLGAKTLCNACGLRWAKRNSKRKPGPSEPSAEGSGGAGEGLVGLRDALGGILPGTLLPNVDDPVRRKHLVPPIAALAQASIVGPPRNVVGGGQHGGVDVGMAGVMGVMDEPGLAYLHPQ